MRRFIFLIVTAFLLLSCDNESATVLGNWLEVKVVNSDGIPQENAEIYFYKDKLDWANYTSPVAGPYMTNSSGVAMVSGLPRGYYYFNISRGDANNRFTTFTMDKPVKEDAVTPITAEIRPLTQWEQYLSGGAVRKWNLLRLKTLNGAPFFDYPVLTEMHADGRWYDSNGRLGLWWFSQDEQKIFYDYNASGAIVASKMIELSDDFFKARIDFFGIAMIIEMVPEE